MQLITQMLRRSSVWYGLMPATIAVVYWFGLHALAFTDGSGWRIPALPKVFFDQTMYLSVMAKDVLHGFHILPFALRPFVWIAHAVWPAVSMSEMYVVGVIGAAILSLWMFAILIQRISGSSKEDACVKSLLAFLIVQVILVLRPGGPSWYVPFFLLAFVCVWIAEGYWEKGMMLRGLAVWVLAIIIAAAYPWYFAMIVATGGLLFLFHFMRPRYVWPLIGIGFVVSFFAFQLRDQISLAVRSSYAVMLAVYGGIGWSHLTTLSNTILVMAAWTWVWLIVARKRSMQGGDPVLRRTSIMLLAAWTAQLVVWFQSLLTGLSIVPDHFIYTVWLLSAISWAVWPKAAAEVLTATEQRITSWIGIVASLFVAYIFVRLATGYYAWSTFSSLLIHIGSWTFLALGMCARRRPRLCDMTALVIGVLFVCIGVWGVRVSAIERTQNDRQLDGVRAWIMAEQPSADLRWCSDFMASDYLFSSTGQAFYPNVSEKHDPVPIEVLQDRLVEQSTYFDVAGAGDVFRWDDVILHDLEFPCRVFGPMISMVDRLPISRAQKDFISGCSQSWADGERARVVQAMADRWTLPVPKSSALCDRFVVRKSLSSFWRIPAAYTKMYEDELTAVYGLR